jgi:hypothetical protein
MRPDKGSNINYGKLKVLTRMVDIWAQVTGLARQKLPTPLSEYGQQKGQARSGQEERPK